MNRSTFNNDIYSMYEEECNKNSLLHEEIREYKLEICNLKYELDYSKQSFDNKLKKEVENAINPFKEENIRLKNQLVAACQEIDRLKSCIQSDNNSEKDYIIDKLINQVNKDSTNSGIPTSKEIKKSNNKTGVNIYNHREKKSHKNGGQFGHRGTTLTKDELLKKINDNNIKTKK